jgi:4-oxalocrotonate tautomerase
MPYLHLTLGRTIPAETQQQLASRSTALLQQLLHKRAEVTAVRIECTADAWFINGAQTAAALLPCHGEVCITAGSNSGEEKAAFLAAWHALIGEICGPLPEASYLVIREIAADNWGYDGKTQASRLTARQAL